MAPLRRPLVVVLVVALGIAACSSGDADDAGTDGGGVNAAPSPDGLDDDGDAVRPGREGPGDDGAAVSPSPGTGLDERGAEPVEVRSRYGKICPPQPLTGLIDRKDRPAGSWDDVVGGYVLDVAWAELEPAAGELRLDRVITELDRATDAGLQVRLRMFAGTGSPDWLLDDAGSFDFVNPETRQPERAPRWWDDRYVEAYASVMDRLALRLDGHPALSSVVISGGGVSFAEPMLRGLATGDASREAALEAGWDLEADLEALRAFTGAHASFTCARSYLAANPFQRWDTQESDLAITEDLLRHARDVLGERAELGNNSLRTPPIPGYVPMYDLLAELGPPLSFQTAQAQRVGDLVATIELAADLGAASVELPSPAYESLLTPGLGQELASTLVRS